MLVIIATGLDWGTPIFTPLLSCDVPHCHCPRQVNCCAQLASLSCESRDDYPEAISCSNALTRRP
eukprot:7600972-Heterocapsa_arctica.AAC.1